MDNERGSVSKSTLNDVDDFDDIDSSPSSRRPTYDDDDDDDNIQKQKPLQAVDLSKFGLDSIKGVQAESVPEEELGEVEDEEEEKDDDEDYETEDEEGELDPGDEILPAETLSQEKLRLQWKRNKKLQAKKKDRLIEDYVDYMGTFQQTQGRNVYLKVRLTSDYDKKQYVIDRHIEMQKAMVNKVKDTMHLEKLHHLESCKSLELTKHKSEKARKRKRKLRPHFKTYSGSSVKPDKRMRFTTGSVRPKDPQKEGVSKYVVCKKPRQPKRDLTVGELKQLYLRVVENGASRNRKRSVKVRCPSVKDRPSFVKDVTPPNKVIRRSPMELSGEHATVDTIAHKQDLLMTPHLAFTAGRSRNKPDSQVSKEARQFAKSKSRVAVQPSRQGSLLDISEEVDVRDLHHFDFAFINPSLVVKHVSTKIRNETLKTLEHRHIPISQLKWPMHLKGFGFEHKNPYGRVHLHYTRVSHQEQGHPYTAYRMTLTNIAYLRAKEQRLIETHRKNRIEFEDERQHLASSASHILTEIFRGLRIWASVSGISGGEKIDAKEQTEKFIHDFKNTFECLLDLFTRLYKTILAHELAARSLARSEAKGEGAQLEEFKEIIRTREKLKAEHRSVQQFLMRFQKHSKSVLQHIRNNDDRTLDMMNSISRITVDMERVTNEIKDVVQNVRRCQNISFQQQLEEKTLKKEQGILAYPRVLNNYTKTMARNKETKVHRFELARQINGVVREVHNITPRRPNSKSNAEK